MVMGGLSISVAIGPPAGMLVGAAGRRVTLWVVTALGLVAATGVAVTVPAISLPAASLRDRLRPLREPPVLGVLMVTVLALAGTHVVYPYIGPALGGAHRPPAGVGCRQRRSNTLGGTLSDRCDPQRVGLVAAAVELAVAPLAVGHFGTAIVWAAVWGIFVSLPVVPQQHRLVASAPSAAAVLLGLNSSSIHVGVAAGGALGGILHPPLTPALLGLVAPGSARSGRCSPCWPSAGPARSVRRGSSGASGAELWCSLPANASREDALGRSPARVDHVGSAHPACRVVFLISDPEGSLGCIHNGQ
jgi:MFS transporter, DHA1 family, inner membrane transport protein